MYQYTENSDMYNHLSGLWKNSNQSAMEIALQIQENLAWGVQIHSSVWVPKNAKNTVYLYVTAPEFVGTKTYYVIECNSGIPDITFVSHDVKGSRGNKRYREHENEVALQYYVREFLRDNSKEREMAAYKELNPNYSIGRY